MKVLLATLSIEDDSRNVNHPDAAYSLGLAYIYSVLEEQHHDVKLLFLNNYNYKYSEETFLRVVKDWQPQIVGLQIFSMNRISSFAAMRKLQMLYPHIKIVIGGVHPSVMFHQILEKFNNVIAVIGEGEVTFKELIESFMGSRPLESVDGIAYYKNGKVITTNPRELMENLDMLPMPKHEVFFNNDPSRICGHIISSRGCPFDCTFCCLKVISKRKYRTRSIEKIVEEIKSLKNKYPQLRQIQFHDDTFLLNNERVIDFCKLIIKEKLGLTFICSARVKPISHEMFHWMQQAGFVKIMFGLETGSAKLLNSIHKKVTKEDVVNLFHVLRPFNFTVTTFLMCGFPGETENTIQETINLVKQTQKIHYNLIAGIGKLWVYPGTEVYRIMKEKGCITDEFWMTEYPVPYFTVEHDLKTLIRFEEKLMNHLSISRIFTIQGFIYHFMSMPFTIIRSLPKPEILSVLVSTIPLKKYFPRLYLLLLKIYKSCIK